MGTQQITDLSYLREIAMGDEDTVIEITEAFLDDVPHTLEKMKNHFANKEWEKLYEQAHKIKPNLQYMGMDQARELILEIEEQARTENIEDDLGQKIEKIDDLCSQAIDELSSKIKQLKAN